MDYNLPAMPAVAIKIIRYFCYSYTKAEAFQLLNLEVYSAD